MIKAAIFDMDGLLIDSEPIWQKANEEIYRSLGIEITPKIRETMIGVRASENAENLFRLYPWKGPSPQEVEGMLLDKVVAMIKDGIELKPGVHSVLSICKKAKLPVAIASSSPSIVIDTVVDAVEIREHFDHIYSAQFEEYGKPHPGVFIQVAEHFKIAPANCLVFEDSPSGVLAAKAAKMKCIAVPELTMKDHSFIKTADIVIDSLEVFDEEMLASF